MNATYATRRNLARLLHRTSFGPVPGQYAKLLAVATTPAALAATLTASTNAANRRADALLSPAPQFDGPLTPSSQAAADQRWQLVMWWLDRLTTTEQPALERATWFWHGLWATSMNKVTDARFMLVQNQTVRAQAFAHFHDLATAMVRDPAMLVWLDGMTYAGMAPNENLARELLERFSLGVGNFAESDVREAARALTGQQIDYANVATTFNPKLFDRTSKTILGRAAGYDSCTLVDRIVAMPANASYLANAVWRVYGGSSAATTAQLRALTSALGAERDSGAMFAAMTSLLATTSVDLPRAASPVEWAVAVMRALGLRPATLFPATQMTLYTQLQAMGQLPFYPPNVGGWPTGAAWFSVSNAQARISLALTLAEASDLDWLDAVPPARRAAVLADRLAVPRWRPATADALDSRINSAVDAFVIAVTAPEYLVGV